MFGAGDDLHIGRVVLRGTASAIDHAHATLPAALARTHWPADEAIIVVRRLTVGGTAAELPARAAAAAHQLTHRAADPWSPAADSAEAVRFRDALDYRACLVRDLLAGTAARRWQWRHRAALLARPAAEALAELLAEDALALPTLLDRPALSDSLPTLWRTLDARGAREVLKAIGSATGWHYAITSALTPPTNERRADEPKALSAAWQGVVEVVPAIQESDIRRKALRFSALRFVPPHDLGATDPRIVLHAMLAIWTHAPATLATASADETLRTTAEMLARPAPDSFYPAAKQMMAAGQGSNSLPFKGRAGVGMGQADGAETHPPPNQESRLRLAASQAASSARRNPCFAPLEGGGKHADDTLAHSSPPAPHRVSSVAASPATLPPAADVDFHTRGGGFFFLLNVLNLPALRDWRATLSARHAYTGQASCSSPFKGEVRRGMGLPLLPLTHPHPNPPLEGEGVPEPQAGWRELVRFARRLDFTPDAPLAAFLAHACALDAADDPTAALATLSTLPPGAKPDPVRHAALRYYGEAALLAALAERPAHVRATRSHLDVHLRLADVDLDIRRSGLDLDPGWLPWLGCVVHFHYDSGGFPS